MRIIRVEAFEFHRVLDGTAWNPAWRWRERRAPLLRITAEDGIAGLGEGWCDQTRIADFFTRARAVAGDLVGRDAPAPAGTEDRAAAAVASAIDIALWDMRARRSRLPLHRALGATQDTVAAYASGGLYADGKDDAALAAEMRGHAARGFTAVKMKIGALDRDADLRRVRVVRDAIGPDAAIMVDAVGRLTRATAPDWFARLRALGVHAVQMPLAAGDVAGMAALQRLGALDVVADETAFRPAAFRRLLDAGAVGCLQFNPGLAGGLSGGSALIAHGGSGEPARHPAMPRDRHPAGRLPASRGGARRRALGGVPPVPRPSASPPARSDAPRAGRPDHARRGAWARHRSRLPRRPAGRTGHAGARLQPAGLIRARAAGTVPARQRDGRAGWRAARTSRRIRATPASWSG